MKHIIENKPQVADAFFALTKQIREQASLPAKFRELIILSVLTATRSTKGIEVHVQRAVAEGATKDEIISTILLAMPVTGVPSVNIALDKAVEVYDNLTQQEMRESQ